MDSLPSQKLIETYFNESRRRSIKRHNRLVLKHAERRQKLDALIDYFDKLQFFPNFR